MPDNSFENKLSRQMEDFNYPASDAVWQKLEANLQRRKKRRWAIIWFYSGLVLVSAGLYFMTMPSFPNKGISIVSNNQKADIPERLPDIPNTNSTDKILIPVNKSQSKDSRIKLIILEKENKYNRQEISEKSTENIVLDSNIGKDVDLREKEDSPPVLTADPLGEKVRETEEIETPVADSASSSKTSDSQRKTDSIAVEKILPPMENSKRGLSFGLRFEAGRSANSESNFTKTKSADLVSSPSTGAPPVISNPYTQEPSIAWSFGAWMRKPISQKVDIQTGLTYHHYRTRTTQGDSLNYANSFHILSVPIEMALQINKGKNLPVKWQFGIEPGWMVGSNALFQDTSGFLYNDMRKFNRFQLGIQTGISFRFFQKTQHPLEIGPVFQYMLTPAFKSGSAYDGHLNFLGLRADWKIFKIKSK